MGRDLVEWYRTWVPAEVDLAGFIEGLRNSVEARGYGRVEVVSLEADGVRAVMRLYDSPFAWEARERDHPICHFAAGVFAGVLGALFGAEVTATETRCRGRGDPFCEFAAESATQEPPNSK